MCPSPSSQQEVHIQTVTLRGCSLGLHLPAWEQDVPVSRQGHAEDKAGRKQEKAGDGKRTERQPRPPGGSRAETVLLNIPLLVPVQARGLLLGWGCSLEKGAATGCNSNRHANSHCNNTSNACKAGYR